MAQKCETPLAGGASRDLLGGWSRDSDSPPASAGQPFADHRIAARAGGRRCPASGYPDFPGSKGGETSLEAAQALSEHLGRLQAMTFAAVRHAGLQGLTAHESSDMLGIDRSAIQPRLSELRRKGRIIDSGQRRRNASGRRAIVWIAREARDDA